MALSFVCMLLVHWISMAIKHFNHFSLTGQWGGKKTNKNKTINTNKKMKVGEETEK